MLVPVQAEETPIPELNSVYMYLQDIDSGEVLASSRSQERIYPASMTKMMTAIIAIEQLPDLNERITLDLDTFGNLIELLASMAGYGLYDDPSVLDLLHGALLPSGAECTHALALRVAGSYDAFVELMNQKAKELGMNDTHFTNPTGLHDEDQYSTCEDIAKLLIYCSKNETFMDVISTKDYTSTPVFSHPQGLQMNSHVLYALEDEVPGIQGGKTGYTPEAGRCLASLAEVNGMHLALVTAYSIYIDGATIDARNMYHWAEENYEIKQLVQEHTLLKQIEIIDGKETDPIELYTTSSYSQICKKDSEIKEELSFVDTITAPASTGEPLGSYRVYVDDKVVYEESYTLDHTIEQSTEAYIRDFLRTKSYLIFFYAGVIVLLVTFIYSILHYKHVNRSKRHKKRQEG